VESRFFLGSPFLFLGKYCTMKTLRITGVPEHFNYPWKKVISRQPFLSEGIRLEWIDESRGSGQMNQALRAGETEIALVLTESFLKDFEVGNPSKMIGFHVNSPLIWGIHISGTSQVNSLQDLSTHNFLVSRMGSGSHLMAFVLAQREQWNPESLAFKIINNLSGALDVMNPDHPELFLWEKFTTKPWVDSGEMKRIGEVPSPWPCFVIAVTNDALNQFGEVIFQLRDLIYAESLALKSSKSTLSEISSEYQLNHEDLEIWFEQTDWATGPTISKKSLIESMDQMIQLRIIKSRQNCEDLLFTEKIDLLD
jgi:hypothetical protein